MKITKTANKAGFTIVEVHHSQGFKQSVNYQSADCSFGATVRLDDGATPAQIQAASKALEVFVETGLKKKAAAQRKFLTELSV